MPASPHALENVRRTTKFSMLGISLTIEDFEANSIYASSTTTIPVKFLHIVSTSSKLTKVPVGLLGFTSTTIFVLGDNQIAHETF